MNPWIYDIETIPLSDAALSAIEPEFEAPSNYKDPEKIAAAIAEKRAAWKSRAALSPLTGRVAMLGFGHRGNFCTEAINEGHDPEDGEKEILQLFWTESEKALLRGCILCGWNSHRFDIPFLVQRSWLHGVPVPATARRRLHMPWLDLMQEFCLNQPGETCGLDRAAQFFGVGRKNGSGVDVARLLVTDASAAHCYLLNDLVLTDAIAERMGIGSDQPAVNYAEAAEVAY